MRVCEHPNEGFVNKNKSMIELGAHHTRMYMFLQKNKCRRKSTLPPEPLLPITVISVDDVEYREAITKLRILLHLGMHVHQGARGRSSGSLLLSVG